MPRPLLAAALLLSGLHATAAAGCDAPALGPTDVVAAASDAGRPLHIVTGVVTQCDVAARTFEVALPALHGLGPVTAQLALTGFSRRYGVHQIGFALQGVAAVATPKGVKVTYAATIDGLDSYQLAYTLYATAAP